MIDPRIDDRLSKIDKIDKATADEIRTILKELDRENFFYYIASAIVYPLVSYLVLVK